MIYEKTCHGGDIYGDRISLDFSANINPLGTPESVCRAAIDAIGGICSYPDPCCRALIDQISRHENIPPDQIICGNGAAELIYSYCNALKPKCALELAPTFSEYSSAAQSVGCRIERYPLEFKNGFCLSGEFLHTLERGGWDVLFLCNPNNPTGRLIEPGVLHEICGICNIKGIRLFLDECFLDLSSDGGKNSMKPHLQCETNLFILKAFTKTYGMAGLRLGYGLCSDRKLLSTMSRGVQVWNVSSPAQAAGVAALKEHGFAAAAREIIKRERARLSFGLRELGFLVCESDANYILFYSSADIYDALLGQGILIRDCSNYHCLSAGWYRIAVKNTDDNTRLLNALKRIVEGQTWQKTL